jgi:hypothetical protein
MRPRASEIDDVIARGVDVPLDDAAFDRLARATFAAQFAACAPYRSYCERRGRTPEAVRHWTEIPAVPQTAFKAADLYSDAGSPVRVFETSGTTAGRPGRHLMSEPGLARYAASMLATFRHYVLPEIEGRSALAPICLAPSSEEALHSSLSFMIDGVCRAFCAGEPTWVVRGGKLHVDDLRAALARAERDGRPALLLGTSLAFLDAVEALTEAFELPSGSRLMETGGTKGRKRAIARGELRARLAETFGLPETAVVNEYGMTEACSQFYESTLRDPESPRVLDGPPWARVLICDPETLEPALPGETGVVCLVDLANAHSVSFVLTEDLAVAGAHGAHHGPGSAPFELLGRAAGAEARGCSLAAEEWTRATAGAR